MTPILLAKLEASVSCVCCSSSFVFKYYNYHIMLPIQEIVSELAIQTLSLFFGCLSLFPFFLLLFFHLSILKPPSPLLSNYLNKFYPSSHFVGPTYVFNSYIATFTFIKYELYMKSQLSSFKER